MTDDDLKKILLDGDLEEFVDSIVLSKESTHFPTEKVCMVAEVLKAKFAIEIMPAQIYVVGSAKIGFGIFQKRTREGSILPAFRPFRAESDIDLAVVCPKLFELIWDELSTYANKMPSIPWDSGRLGDYMVYGWLRPDHFPRHVRLRRCDDWWDVFHGLSADSRLGRRSIRAALYHSFEHLRRYQLRGINQCRLSLEARR
ncbi:hypothetical protein [Thiobaca trueperi]|uniref:Uncharacterized protein n=1 Tax=Thiobaca trueperi TaxID=127458 RepID=A0A4R3MTE4_9GAMM|nr:hypothetical protein [Thiobaca trueperi]TCT19698.1 hypothetical protein EDC35_10726 [Thiobaca trueperi]